MDIETDKLDFTNLQFTPTISKVVPIDKDGFEVKQG